MMKKIQRSALIPEELYALLADHRAKTGATFTRQMTAGLLAYCFSDPPADSVWMEAAVRIERGELELADVPSWIAKKKDERSARQTYSGPNIQG